MEQQSNTKNNNTLIYLGTAVVGLLLVICITYFVWPSSETKKDGDSNTKTEQNKTNNNTTSSKKLATCLSALEQGKLQKNKNQLYGKMRSMIAYDLDFIDWLTDCTIIKIFTTIVGYLVTVGYVRGKMPRSLPDLLRCFYVYEKKAVLFKNSIIEAFVISGILLYLSTFFIYGGLSLLFKKMGWVSLSFKQCQAKVATNEVKLKATTKESKAYVEKLTKEKEDYVKAVTILEVEYNKAKAVLNNNTATKEQQKASATNDKLSNALTQYKAHHALLEDVITLMQLLIAKESKRNPQQVKPKS